MIRSQVPAVKLKHRAGMIAGLRAGAEIIEQEVRSRCPVGETGNLKASIRSEIDERTVRGYVIAGNNDAWYARLVERGTSRAAPHPFLRPAVQTKRRAALAAFRAAVRRAV